jgi:hypothetical protein
MSKRRTPTGYERPLFRLRWTNNRNRSAFAIWLASKNRDEDSALPSGSFIGTVEEATDCACGYGLKDISPREWPGQRSARLQ